LTLDRRPRFLWILASGQGLNAMAGGFVYPFFAVYLTRTAGADQGAIAVGTVFALATLLSAGGRIVGGELADRRGRRAVVLSSVAVRSILLALLALGVQRGAPLWVVALPFLLSSIARGAYEPAADAMVADVIPPAERPRAYAAMRIGRNAGWAIGPALGGAVGFGGFATLALAAAGLGFANLLLSARFLSETPHVSSAARFRPSDLALVLHDPLFRRLCLLTTGLFILFAQLLVSVSIDLASRVALTEQQIGWTYTLNGVMVVVLQATVTRLVPNARPGLVLAAGTLLNGIGFLTIGAATGLPMALAGMAIFTFGEMTTLPVSSALAADIAPADQRGRYLGAYGVFMDVGHGLGQIVGGAGLALAGPGSWRFWWVMMVFASVLAAGFVRFDARLRAR
jgi:MFS family permease